MNDSNRKKYGRVINGELKIGDDPNKLRKKYNESIKSKFSNLDDEKNTETIGNDVTKIVNSNHRKIKYNYEMKEEEKRELKKPNSTRTKKRYKGNKKAVLAIILTSLTVGIGSTYVGIKSYNYKKEYKAVAEEVQKLSNKEIQEEIYDILRQEVSDATKTNNDDIKFRNFNVDSGTIRTEVKAGEQTYTADQDLRSPISMGNTLKSGKVMDIVSKANSTEDRKELIKTLIKTRKFSKEKDLEVDGKNLKEIKSREDKER